MSEEVGLSAQVLFCGSFRQELGGKVSIVGLYRGFIGFNSPDGGLPQLVALTLLTFGDAWAGKTARVRLTDQNKVLASMDATLKLAENRPIEALEAVGARAHVNYVNLPIYIVPFSPPRGSRIRVEVDVESFHFVSDELAVLHAPSPAAPPPAPQSA